MVLILIIYNPVIKPVSDSVLPYTQGNKEAVFSRVWILCPIWLTISYCIALCNAKKLKHVMMVFLSAIIVLFGQSIETQSAMQELSNAYKIDEQSVQIADSVLKASQGNPIHLLVFVPYHDTFERFVQGGTIYEGISILGPYRCLSYLF